MNRCIFSGRLTRDWDSRITQSGTAYAKNGIAVTDPYKKDTVYFFELTAWNQKHVDSLSKYTHKGSKIIVECKAVSNEYTNKNGVKVRTVDFHVESWEFGETKKESEAEPSYTPGQYSSQSTPQAPAQERSDSFMRIPNDAMNDEMPFN